MPGGDLTIKLFDLLIELLQVSSQMLDQAHGNANS